MLLQPRSHRVHFDPVASEETPSVVGSSRVASEDFTEPELDREAEQEEPSPPRSREGLPPAFRMRHSRHYVEQVMGDAPLRTVKEVAVADIEPPPDDPADLHALEESIRQLGVLEPLLVGQRGTHYRVIAGRNRLRAARSAGLSTVPCLVHDVDEEMLKNMREAASQRIVPPQADAAADAPPDPPLPPAFAEVTAGLEFVSALMPAISAAGDDRFRWSVLTDLAGIELQRARTVAAVAEALANPPVLNRTEVACGDLIDAIESNVSVEARLRGIRLDAQASDPGYTIAIDRALVISAITGLVQSVMALLPPGGGTVRLHVKGTMVRPALIVQVVQEEVDPGVEGPRYFDGDWRQHPAGAVGGLLSAGVASIARLHGGRVEMQPLPMKGSMLTFVVPKPLGSAVSESAPIPPQAYSSTS
jgi:hypothetical protein